MSRLAQSDVGGHGAGPWRKVQFHIQIQSIDAFIGLFCQDGDEVFCRRRRVPRLSLPLILATSPGVTSLRPIPRVWRRAAAGLLLPKKIRPTADSFVIPIRGIARFLCLSTPILQALRTRTYDPCITNTGSYPFYLPLSPTDAKLRRRGRVFSRRAVIGSLA